jgi:hypothetical protein
VGTEGVGSIGAARDRQRDTRTDEHGTVSEVPTLRREPTPSRELNIDSVGRRDTVALFFDVTRWGHA